MSVATLAPPLAHRKGCPCDACRAIRTQQVTRWRLRSQQGVTFWMDAEPVRAHVLHLVKVYGMPDKAIAAQVGVGRWVLRSLFWGNNGRPPSQRVVAEHGRRLLTARFDLDVIPATSLVNSTGTQRRIQGLAVAGYGGSEVARRLGKLPPNLHRLMRSPAVTAGLARAVRDLANELETVPPPSGDRFERGAIVKARRHAAHHGWVALAAWDDIDNPEAKPVLPDAPDTEPDEAVIAEALRGTLKLGDLREVDLHAVIRTLLARDEGASLFAKLFNCNGSRAKRLVDLVKLRDLLARLDEHGQLELRFLEHQAGRRTVHVVRPDDPDAETALAEMPIATLCDYKGRPAGRGDTSAVDRFVDTFHDDRLCRSCHRALGPFAPRAFEHPRLGDHDA